jgi:hypothetical protein
MEKRSSFLLELFSKAGAKLASHIVALCSKENSVN